MPAAYCFAVQYTLHVHMLKHMIRFGSSDAILIATTSFEQATTSHVIKQKLQRHGPLGPNYRIPETDTQTRSCSPMVSNTYSPVVDVNTLRWCRRSCQGTGDAFLLVGLLIAAAAAGIAVTTAAVAVIVAATA